MNSHKNARLTFVRRREMVADVLERDMERTEASIKFGVSTRTVSKWVRRFEEEGESGLYDRSSRPHTNPNALSVAEAELIVALRQTGLLGLEIAAKVRRAKTTVSKVLRSARLSTQKQLDRDPSPRRYEHEHPGDLIHLDIKKLGKFNQPGHRVMSRSDDRYTASGKGWEYVHVCIDDHSRVAYVEVIDEGETGAATSGFLERAVAHFESIGISVKRVLTDNGSGYTSKKFRKTVGRLGIKHSRTRPYTPKTNGKAERFIQTVQREWAYIRPYRSSAARRRVLPRWVHRYNEERPHGSLGGRPPITRLEAST